MSGTIGYDDLRADTVRTVAKLMAAAAITAPKSGGQLFLAGKPGCMETVIANDPATRGQSEVRVLVFDARRPAGPGFMVAKADAQVEPAAVLRHQVAQLVRVPLRAGPGIRCW